MRTFKFLIIITTFLRPCLSWEYCQSDIQIALCGTQTHFVCDLQNSISKPTSTSKQFLAHVPLTRKVKTSFLNWHNYYRNRTAGGWVKNKKKIYFPKAVRMRELIWDRELSFISHLRTKMVSEGDVDCCNTQRFPFVKQNLIVKAFNDYQPLLEVIATSLKVMFNKKNFIEDPDQMPKQYLESKGNSFKYCYYTACTYDEDNEGVIYKIGKPARRCSRWEVRRSKSYLNLCANNGKSFKRDN